MSEPSILKSKWSQLLFCLALASICLFIASKNSILYAFNEWVDINAYFTMGKSMLNGLIPYRDLIDHKGPYTFLFFGLASLISSNTLHGVFVLELISGIIFLYFVHQIFTRFCQQFAFIGTIGIALFTYSSSYLRHGGSLEQLALPCFTYGLYCIIEILWDNPNFSIKYAAFVNGILFGVLFFTKYTLIGVYVGIVIVLSAKYVLERRACNLFPLLSYAIAGFLLAILPWTLYFLLNDALDDFFRWYFYHNIFSYQGDPLPTSRIMMPFDITYRICKSSLTTTALLVLGLLGVLCSSCRDLRNLLRNLGLIVVIYCMISFCYFGSTVYPYYHMMYYAMLTPCLAMFGGGLLDVLAPLAMRVTKPIVLRFICLIGMLCAAIFVYLRAPNVDVMQRSKSDYPQYTFAELINRIDDATLLNYDFLDGGFYTTAGIIPSNRFYYCPNMLEDEILAEQRSYIASGDITFVVTSNDTAEFLFDYGYQQVAEQSLDTEDTTYVYRLFQLS